MRKQKPIGSISSGTLRTEDLLSSFAWELKYLSAAPNKRHDAKLIREADIIDPESEDAQDLVAELSDALQEYALPYFYFGSHPGDGADMGFWLAEDFDNAFDGLRVSDTSEVPTGYTGEVLQINDHGNMTLFSCHRGRLRAVWSIV